ncbi:MAG: Rpn family recombination-promoting nuclease/putative transposase [Bacteroidaceae bacterium]|nr:Rpn family recombination-promoting nuclease/putative transposase [Bacteroidaceae bacterium]
MVQGKTIDEMKAQAPYSSEDTTSLGMVSPTGSEENNPPLDLRIDIAFKVVFGEKEFMIDLLNSILDRTEEITDVTYQPTESVPAYVNGKKVVFDLKCTLSTGEIIIVEMQYASQSYFKERALYYMARNIESQLRKWNSTVGNADSLEEARDNMQRYRLHPVIGIFITNFSIEQEGRLMRDFWLTDVLDNNRKFTDKMRMIFLELPFMKQWDDCDTELKKWLFIIKNSKDMDKIPFTNDRPIYRQLAEKARYASLTPEEQELYDYDLRNYLAYVDSMIYAEDKGVAKGRVEGLAEGRAEGKAEEKLQIAQNLKALGIDIQTIQKSTGLTVEEINNL